MVPSPFGPTDIQIAKPDSEANLLLPIMKRWPVLLLTIIVICAVGIPAIWFLIEPMHETEGAILVSPIAHPIMFSSSDYDKIPNYQGFMNTQAELIASNNVVNRVADDLLERDLEMFRDIPDPVNALKTALAGGAIKIEPGNKTELIKIIMKSRFPDQAEQIVDAFIRAYMAIAASEEIVGGDRKLSILEDKRKVLSEQIDRQRDAMRQLADEFGSTALTSRQQMMLEQVISLQNEVTSIEIQQMSLEAKVQMYEDPSSGIRLQEDIQQRKDKRVNSDLVIQALTSNILRYEELVILGRQKMTAKNPELKRRIEVLETMKSRITERKQEVSLKFDKDLLNELAKKRSNTLVELKTELAQTIRYKGRLSEKLALHNTETIEVGRKQLAIDDQREQLGRIKEMYNAVNRRIAELDMERKRPARIAVAYNASSILAANKRLKLIAALCLGAVAMGAMLALLRDKTDKSLHNADDIVKHVGMRIIGTTTNPNNVRSKLLKQQLSDDYQTIRANLELLDGKQQSKAIVITSPGADDGKTTFAVNLATSFAGPEKRVLLIDGDLRKPDIAKTFGIPDHTPGLDGLLAGKTLEESVYTVPSMNIDVLTAKYDNSRDVVDLLTRHDTAECVRIATELYDYVIIDTPPVLAFSDALLWATMADSVILTSFVEHTSGPDLRETIRRIEQVDVKLLGTVLHNVNANKGYHRYGYAYMASAHKKHGAGKRIKHKVLLPAANNRPVVRKPTTKTL